MIGILGRRGFALLAVTLAVSVFTGGAALALEATEETPDPPSDPTPRY